MVEDEGTDGVRARRDGSRGIEVIPVGGDTSGGNGADVAANGGNGSGAEKEVNLTRRARTVHRERRARQCDVLHVRDGAVGCADIGFAAAAGEGRRGPCSHAGLLDEGTRERHAVAQVTGHGLRRHRRAGSQGILANGLAHRERIGAAGTVLHNLLAAAGCQER